MESVLYEVLCGLNSFSLFELIRWIIDFSIVYTMFYYILLFLKGTKSSDILVGIVVVFFVIVTIAVTLNLSMLRYLLGKAETIIVLAIIVIFQPELRRAFSQAGSLLARNVTKQSAIDEVVRAVEQMSETKTGALIVFARNIGMAGIVNTSVHLDAEVNALLLESIFFKNSPLHDCAVIIKNNRIVAAHAVLPLMQEDVYNPVRRLGTRHRAAIGITEETDAMALVVSEETGTISLAYHGQITRGVTSKELEERLKDLLIRDNHPLQSLYTRAVTTFTHTEEKTVAEQQDQGKPSQNSEKKS